MKIAIVDYGMGNIYSVQNALRFINVESEYTNNQKVILSADKIILPGVGSYCKAMHTIKKLELDLVIKEAVLNRHIPILGICLGMQLLGTSSTEDGFTQGLGIFNGVVSKINLTERSIKIPHIGFNTVIPPVKSILYNNISENSDFYFIHSYKMLSDEKSGVGYCNYGGNFIASFEQSNIFGTQFHPEKSQKNGLLLLKNFTNI